MQAAIDQFRRNIQRVRNLGAIYQALSVQTTQALDVSDLLRSELVMAVSALDHYIHELVRLGMLEAYQGNRVQTDAFLRFQITLSGALEAVNAQGNDSWLEDQIRSSHSYRSFQTPGQYRRRRSPRFRCAIVGLGRYPDGRPASKHPGTTETNRESPESNCPRSRHRPLFRRQVVADRLHRSG